MVSSRGDNVSYLILSTNSVHIFRTITLLNEADDNDEPPCAVLRIDTDKFQQIHLQAKNVSQVWNYICILEFSFLPEANSTPISHDGLGLSFFSPLYINTGQHSHPQSLHKRIRSHSFRQQKETPPYGNLHEHLLPFKRISGSFFFFLKDQNRSNTQPATIHFTTV